LLRDIAQRRAGARYVVLAELVEQLLDDISNGELQADLGGSVPLLAIDDVWPWAGLLARRATWEAISTRLIHERVLRGKPTWMALESGSDAARPLLAAVEQAGGPLARRGVRRIVLRSPSRRKRMKWLAQEATLRGLRADHALFAAIAGFQRPWSYGVARGRLLTSAFAMRCVGPLKSAQYATAGYLPA
jgi:hypothetical protein